MTNGKSLVDNVQRYMSDGGGDDNDMADITDAQMNKIADKVVAKLEAKVFRSNFVEKDADGKATVEDAKDANIFDTLASANTNTTRVFLGKGLA